MPSVTRTTIVAGVDTSAPYVSTASDAAPNRRSAARSASSSSCARRTLQRQQRPSGLQQR